MSLPTRNWASEITSDQINLVTENRGFKLPLVAKSCFSITTWISAYWLLKQF